MSSFSIMCKAIGHSIQNRLLCKPVKYYGRSTACLIVISKSQWLFKMGNCFLYSLYVTIFVILVKPLYKAMLLHITSSLVFFCTLFLLRWGVCSYRRVLFSRFYLGIDSGLIVVNLVKLECVDVLFWCITHCTNYVIYLEKIQTKNV